MINEERFEWAKNKIIGKVRDRNGIGTLSEKSIHAVLKNYYEPDEKFHEINVEGSVADIFTGTEIIEIQTRNFDKIRGKLEKFLPLYPVTLVYPIPGEKRIIWIDEETGEFSNPRKSPLKGSPYLAFGELYKIKQYLMHENLHLRLVLIDMDEYKLLNGWSKDKKKGSSRFDRIPERIAEEICIDCPQDYMQLIPFDLEEPFSVKEFAKKAHIRTGVAQVVVHILHYTGNIERVGKKGNAYLYRVNE